MSAALLRRGPRTWRSTQLTLALMVPKTLDGLGPLHGYGIARRIEPVCGDQLAVNQGTLYPRFVAANAQDRK